PMDAAESMRQFVGFTIEQTVPVIEARLGRAVPPGWVETVRGRIITELSRELALMPGVREVLDAVAQLGLPSRVASNSSRREMRAKFARTGLDALLERAHSADEVARGKPAPDVFLAAAAAEGVPPGACVVIEDSVPGATAARAAGMACVGLAPHGDGASLRQVGANVIRSLFDLPPLLRAAMQPAA
ncbi:MAG: HAD family phosphatase, partial [Pseudomonadota bacterium]|nr:HAD family phosphatase [Pseudomonadota bacterium]